METSKILNSTVLDIIFDGRNKMYGAYELRNHYNGRLVRALAITASLALLVSFSTVWAGKTDDIVVLDVYDPGLAHVIPDAAPLPPVPPPPPPRTNPTPPNQVRFLTPVVTTENQADEVIEDLTETAAISSVTLKNENINALVEAPIGEVGSEVFERPALRADDSVYLRVERDAEFPDGVAAWARYLQKNLNAEVPVRNGAAPGMYQVVTNFIVNKDGTVREVHAETKIGYGMEEEAIKIISRGPKWIPALQNGRNVNAYRRQAITFVVEE